MHTLTGNDAATLTLSVRQHNMIAGLVLGVAQVVPAICLVATMATAP